MKKNELLMFRFNYKHKRTTRGEFDTILTTEGKSGFAVFANHTCVFNINCALAVHGFLFL